MRLVVAMMRHETNTFSPVPTPLARFGAAGPDFGNSAAENLRGTNNPFAAYLDIAEKRGATVATPVAGNAPPSGPVQRDAFEKMANAVLEAVDKGCDAVMLDLHGAMVTEDSDDGEGELLQRIRKLRPGIPIAVALDLHANITPAIIDNCTVLTGYKTYPHVDMYETGRLAGDILMRALDGEIDPKIVWGRKPMLPHTLKMGHDDEPMRSLIARARQAEASGALAMSVFGGFPLADIPQPGLSVVGVADAKKAASLQATSSAVDAILAEGWARRAEFVYHSEKLSESIGRAKKMAEGPVLLIDHADNCASGGTQDTVAVLREALKQGLKDMAVFAICDPQAVEEMAKAGVGNRVTLKLGGKTDMPTIGAKGEPLEITGMVRALTDGNYLVTGPMQTGTQAHMGRSAILHVDGIDIAVIERHHEPFDLGCLRSLGVEPTNKRYVLLKSRIHYRAGFKPIAKAIVECDGEGVTTSDYGRFRFEKLERPSYPLDA